MITNLPTQESLNDVALRIYFRAWDDLIGISSDFSRYFGQEGSIKATRPQWPDEWTDYLTEAQSDLQSICSLFQQSMELALNARICAVSPYLLLLDSGMKMSASPKNVDFSKLRTLDAIDLPGAVNTLTNQPVTDEFVGMYASMRSLRNKVTHLGEAGISLDPDKVLRQAVSLYASIWPDRGWLSDRLEFAGRTRLAWMHDNKYTSTHMVVLQEWPIDMELLTKGEFKRLFHHDKATRRYICHHCIYAGDTRYAGLDKPECGTAYLDTAGTTIHCIMCDETFGVERKECPNCEGNVSGGNNDQWDGYCHTCGCEPEEKPISSASRPSSGTRDLARSS